MENKIIKPTQETLVKCDNPSCDYKVLNENMDPSSPQLEKYINLPCPKCGENLLTEEDYKDFKKMLAIMNSVNELASLAGISDISDSDEDQVLLSVGVHKGKFTIKVKEDEQKDK